MRARRDLRHDAAEAPVFLKLAAHEIGEDFALARTGALHDRCRGLVAARLYPEHAERPGRVAGRGRVGLICHVSNLQALMRFRFAIPPA
ncbi:MAG: hypothetical protein Kow0032_09030 [Methyloligellaceae bacterium]